MLEVAVGVEHLDAAVAAVGDVDVVVAVDLDVVRVVDAARVLVGVVAAAPELPPRLDPVAVLVELRDARVHVAVADVDVVVAIPRHVGRAVERAFTCARVRLRRAARSASCRSPSGRRPRLSTTRHAGPGLNFIAEFVPLSTTQRLSHLSKRTECA